MFALLGLPADAFGWLFFLLICAMVVTAFIAVAFMVQANTEKLYDRVRKNEVRPHRIAYRACCPPGLGCNDDTGSRNSCRRQLAYSLADAEETEQLDTYWSSYKRTPNDKSLRNWERHRDTLIDSKLSGAENHAHKKKLLGHHSTVELLKADAPAELAEGEVVPLYNGGPGDYSTNQRWDG